MISIIRHGVKKTSFPKKIIIAGAGMAGLVSGSLLKASGHDITILESAERVGGRVYTLRSAFQSEQYLDAGAMRIPSVHLLTLEYIRKFNLPINEFISRTPNDLIYVNGIKTTLKKYVENPDILGYPLAPWERNKNALELFLIATRPVLDFMNQNPEKNWKLLMREFDKYSIEHFLRHNPVGPSLSAGAVDQIKTLMALSGFPELSFLGLLKELQYIIDPNIRFYEITGGNDQLPHSFLPELRDNVWLEHKITEITQNPNSITIHSIHSKTSERFEITGDLAIITIPFSAFKFIRVEPYNSFSQKKWQAIRQLHYVSSTKIGIQFKSRFWEKEGLYGGHTVTDLPIRFTYYPSHGIGSPGPGVVLASYTWEDESDCWESLNEEERVQQALKNLSIIHGNQVHREFIAGCSYVWNQSPHHSGAFSLFKPEQGSTLGPYLSTPEGRVHFADEHASDTPAWMQGAIESAIRVVNEVNDLPNYN
ncbi:flavin monoamine oxidase family protein [Cohnella kolymensis]|nr:flavin monoamine oxidase family protein [Cohnella kolymensis]